MMVYWLESLPLQQRVQFARSIECREVIEATNMGVTNKDLWHCSPPTSLLHALPPRGISINKYLGVFRPFSIQQGLGHAAVGAGLGAVDFDCWHDGID